MEFPVDQLLAPVEGHDDLTAFMFDFSLGEKALGDTITEEDNGDLIIEGYAAVFDGVDRQGENFAPGAFTRGCKAFLDSQAALCYHHKRDMVLGKVLDLDPADPKGLRMRARVDGEIRNHPVLGTIYHQIKKGTLNGLSVKGFFRRMMTEAGPRIADMDFTEISVTGVPIHPGTNFAVLASKALGDNVLPLAPEQREEIRAEIAAAEDDVNQLIARLDAVFTNLTKAVIEQNAEDADTANETEQEEEAAPVA